MNVIIVARKAADGPGEQHATNNSFQLHNV